jgi:hypothetical protein
MPYGIQKDKGGDTKENVDKMKSCIDSIKGDYTKEQKIAICKKRLFGKKKESEAERELKTYRHYFIQKTMKEGKTFNQASELFNKHLITNNYIF